MIAKCVVILAIVAQINCYAVTSNCGTPVIASGCGSGFVGTSAVLGSSGIVGSSAVVGSSGVVSSPTTRNIVAKGKYPITLESTGPAPDPRIPVTTSHVQAPLQEKPTVRLSARIPAPRTVAHSCTCYKQILRPRVHDQYITVPTVQRYIETTHKPVVENIHYEAIPLNADSYGNCVSDGVQLAAQTVPVAAAVESSPVGCAYSVPSCGAVESVPVAATLESAPCSTAYGITSFPVRSYSTGCGCTCGCAY